MISNRRNNPFIEVIPHKGLEVVNGIKINADTNKIHIAGHTRHGAQHISADDCPQHCSHHGHAEGTMRYRVTIQEIAQSLDEKLPKDHPQLTIVMYCCFFGYAENINNSGAYKLAESLSQLRPNMVINIKAPVTAKYTFENAPYFKSPTYTYDLQLSTEAVKNLARRSNEQKKNKVRIKKQPGAHLIFYAKHGKVQDIYELARNKIVEYNKEKHSPALLPPLPKHLDKDFNQLNPGELMERFIWDIDRYSKVRDQLLKAGNIEYYSFFSSFFVHTNGHVKVAAAKKLLNYLEEYHKNEHTPLPSFTQAEIMALNEGNLNEHTPLPSFTQAETMALNEGNLREVVKTYHNAQPPALQDLLSGKARHTPSLDYETLRLI